MPYPPVEDSRTAGRWLVASGVGVTGFLVVAGLVLATGGTDRVDSLVGRDAVALRTSTLTEAARAATFLGSTPVVVAVAVIAAGVLWWRRSGPAFPQLLLFAVTVTLQLVRLLKVGFERTRPPLGDLLGPPAVDGSFPSGHTTSGGLVYALAAVLLALTVRPGARRWLLLALGLVVVVCIGLSRVYLGYHWASDVIAGWLLAGAIAAAAVRLALALAGPVEAGEAGDAPGAVSAVPGVEQDRALGS